MSFDGVLANLCLVLRICSGTRAVVSEGNDVCDVGGAFDEMGDAVMAEYMTPARRDRSESMTSISLGRDKTKRRVRSKDRVTSLGNMLTPSWVEEDDEMDGTSGNECGNVPSWFHYGNYMGPCWNDGKRQVSQRERSAPCVDYGDCRSLEHDDAYANGEDLHAADLRYAGQMIGQGEGPVEVVRNTFAGLAVGAQGVVRGVTKFMPTQPKDVGEQAEEKKPFYDPKSIKPLAFKPFG